jgi:hypothetical protein
MSNPLPECISGISEWKELAARLEALSLRRPMKPVETSSFEVTCEMCEALPATVYCGQDKAHLCPSCDESHHSSSKLLMKHGRLPVYHSPYQFGNCKVHQGDKYECVCLECGEMLCQLCLLVGSHAGVNNHPVVSTIDAFRLSLTPPSGDASEILKGGLSKVFFAVQSKKTEMMNELKAKHALVIQAESNHWAVQQSLDKQLRSTLEQLEKKRNKRLDYINSLRRENLLLLTMIEWIEAFTVHARLSLPPSLWLPFYHNVSADPTKVLLLNSRDGSNISRIDTVADYVKSLPGWVTNQIEVRGMIDVFTDSVDREKLSAAVSGKNRVITSQFEWVPSSVPIEADKVSLTADELRQNRMAHRLDELLSLPQEESNRRVTNTELSLPPILANQKVPLDNIKDFVMQTLAVLAETESSIPILNFPEKEIPKNDKISSVLPPLSVLQPEAPVMAGVSRIQGERKGEDLDVPKVNPEERLKGILYQGSVTYGNSVSLISAAPSSDRQELIRLFISLFSSKDRPQVEELIFAICRDTVNGIESSSFLVSGISILVPLTATFMLSLYPQDFVFLDGYLAQLTGKVLALPNPDQNGAEQYISEFLGNISAPSANVSFPNSIKFLLQTVYKACLLRFPPQVAAGVVSGLFLARVVAPRLVWSSPKTGGEIQAPPVITLMTRYIHRIAGAAADGQSALTRSEDPSMAAINGTISQVNALLMREVIGTSVVSEERLPPLTGLMTPEVAASKLERKIKEYGQVFMN